jgi:hypothetical protein
MIGDLVNIDDVLVFSTPGAAINLDVAPQMSRIGMLRDWNNAYGIATHFPASGYGTVAPSTTGTGSQSTFTSAAASPITIASWLSQGNGGGGPASLNRTYDLFDTNNVCVVEACMSRNLFAGGNPRQIGGILLYGASNGLNGVVSSRIVDANRSPGQQTAPAVPATTVPLRNPFFRDAIVTVSGGTVTAITVNSVSTGVTSGVLFVPANGNIAIAYSSVPTWTWQTA